MAQFSFSRFNGGLFSSKLSGRPEYKGSAQMSKNFLPSTQGFLYRRGGTRYLTNIANATDDTRLASFVYNKDVAYTLVFKVGAIDVYKSGVFITTVSTNYTADDLGLLYFYQTGDVMYVACSAKPLKVLKRTGDTTFSIEDVVFDEPPYLLQNTTTITLTANATVSAAGNTTITASGAVFSATDVGRYVRMVTAYSGGVHNGWGKITSFNSATQVVIAWVGGQINANSSTKDWRLSAFSPTTGYPNTVVVHESRMFLTLGSLLFMSKSGVFTDYQLTDKDGNVLDNYGASLPLNMEKSNGAKWIYSDFQLLLGGDSEEYRIYADNYGTGLTPKNVKAKVSSREGSEFVPPIMLDYGVIFVKRFGRKIVNFSYDVEQYAYKNTDLSKYNDDITQGKVWEMAFCNDLQPILWVIKEDGALFSCTMSVSDSVIAYAEHDVGGKVMSVCSVPEGDRDALYLIVKRNVNGSDVYYFERMEVGLAETATDTKEAFFLDCGLTVSSENKMTSVSVSHLIGKEVSVLADGAVQNNKIVNEDGMIDLDTPAKIVSVGLGYTSVYSPVPESVQDMVLELKNKRVTELLFRLYKTVGISVGTSFENLTQQPFRTTKDKFDTPVSLKTEDRKFYPIGGWEQDGNFYFAQTQPLPCTVLAVYLNMAIGG